MLHGIKPGAGRKRNVLRPLFLLSSGPQAGRGGDHARLGAHCPRSSISFCRTILPFPLPISHVPFVLPQGRTEELEESSQCTLLTSPEGLHCPLGVPLPSAGGSPLEKNQHCPRCVPSLERIYPVGPSSPSTGMIAWVSVPLRLTRCSWLRSAGGVSPSTFFLTSP